MIRASLQRFRHLACAVIILGLLAMAQAEMRTFTDTQGRTLQAELLESTPTTVRIQRDDGRIFEIERTTLSRADLDYIRDWEWKRAFAFGGIEISPRRVRLETERTQTKSSTKKVETWCYKIVVKNGSRTRLDGLVLEFRVFHVDDTAKESKVERPLKRERGRLVVGTLEPGASTEVQTPGLELDVVQLKPGYHYSGTNKRRVEDSLEGIWVRVLHGSSILAEHSAPASLKEKEGW